jgi:predicted nucleic acid-binding protein
VEVLGYHDLKNDERRYFDDIFSFVPIILPSPVIFDKAIEIRASYRLKLGDSIIAATALIHDLTLYTRNVSDFEKIAGLKMVNPIK